MPIREKKEMYKAMLARDPRYDGRFYTGVTTTGIYCRPVCPARPKIENVIFLKSKAEAEKSGFRPCLRCRPDLSPLSPQWKGTAAVIPRALRLIEKNESLKEVALQLGLSDRHLRRLFQEHLGASPVEIQTSNRLHLARQLLSETRLSMLDVGLAAGFGSPRRFNEAFRKIYQRAPRDFRREAGAGHPADLSLELGFAEPYDWDGILDFFRRHEVHQTESVTATGYTRFFKSAHGMNSYSVSRGDGRPCLKVSLALASLADLRPTVENIRRQFDLAHNPHHLKNSFRGLRIPGAFDPFETAVCIILGQLVSLRQARENIKKLVLRFGAFPDAAKLARADLGGLGFTSVRIQALRELGRQVSGGLLDLSPACDLAETRAKLLAIKGIGPWTVEMIALRCLSDTDAFPEKDLIVARGLEKLNINPSQFSPWRGYLALSLWKKNSENT